MNTDDYFTTTATVTGTDTTLTVVCKISICSFLPDSIPDLKIDYYLAISTTVTTETPAPMTVLSGVFTASTVTITAPTPTKTRTAYTNAVVSVTSTRVKTWVYFIPSAQRSCHANLANLLALRSQLLSLLQRHWPPARTLEELCIEWVERKHCFSPPVSFMMCYWF